MKQLLGLIDISKIKRISFRQDINGLRAIAVLSVVFYHADLELFKGGWLGVDIFFVISGFLISNIIISELNEEKFSFKAFYLRRIKRILPALFSTLVLTIPFAYVLLTPKAMEEYIDSMIASIFFYANYHFMNLDFYIAESTKLMPLLHTWSLAIEEQFYLLFPLFTVLIYKYFKKYFTLFIVLITFCSIYINTLTQGSEKFYKLEYRIWELLLGVLIMILSSNIKIKHLEKIGIILMFFPIFYFSDIWINDTEPKLLALTGVSLIIFSNSENTILSKLLNLKPLTFIGLSSYSIYLLHQPFFAFYRIFLNNFNLLTIKNFNLSSNILNVFDYEVTKLYETNYIIVNTLLIIFLLLISYWSYKNIELRFTKISQLLILFLLLSFFAIFQVSNYKTYIASEKSKNTVTEETVLSLYNCWDKLDSFEDPIEKLDQCIINNNSDKYLLIIGDSSTISLHKSLTKNNQLGDYNYIFASMEYGNLFPTFTKKHECNECFFNWIKQRKNNVTIIVLVEIHRYVEQSGIYYQNGTPEFRNIDNFITWIDKLSGISNNVIVVEPFPTMIATQMDPKDVLYASNNTLDEIYIPLKGWRQNTTTTLRLFSKLKDRSNNIHVLEVTDLFCENNSNKCLVYKKPTLFYIDKTHLSIEGGSLVINKLKKFIKEIE